VSTQASRDVRFIDVLLLDMQGRLRSKRLPASARGKLLDGETRMPLSTQAQDIFGEDGEELTGMGLENGDPDGFCIPVENTLTTQPWNPEAEQVLVSLFDNSGAPSAFDPRQQLVTQVEALAAAGMTATVAVELEFYLFDQKTRELGRPVVPACLGIAGEPNDLQLYDIRVIDRIEPVLNRIHGWSRLLGIPAEATLAEFGPGQFEINLKHRSCPLQAADDAIMFRRIVDRAAFESKLIASFMAKPWGQHGGSGQHVHLSVLDQHGHSVFDSDRAKPGKTELALPLEQAVAGLLDTMADAQLVFAPHGNSYRRLVPGSFAPHRVDWGFDHRAAAVRIPETHGPNARLEHRVAGSDANAYLLLAALLGGVHHGLKSAALLTTPPLVPGERSTGTRLTHDWLTAAERFGSSNVMRGVFGDAFVDTFCAIKTREAETYLADVGSLDWRTWLSRI
jgi:glutamine synthetase